jgi:hypothetical protein
MMTKQRDEAIRRAVEKVMREDEATTYAVEKVMREANGHETVDDLWRKREAIIEAMVGDEKIIFLSVWRKLKQRKDAQ